MGELITPILFVVVGFFFYREAGSLKIKEGYPMTSASFPKVIAVLLILCGIALIVKVLIQRKKYIEAEKKLIFDPRLFLALALLIAFYFLLEPVGYIISGIVLMVGISLFMQKGKPKLFDTVILPVTLPIVMYFIFQFMSIYLPVGDLFGDLF